MAVSEFTSMGSQHLPNGRANGVQANGTDPYDIPVLIVGGGPAGLLQSYLLSVLGIKNLIIERYPERLGAPKAHALSPRSLEICRQFGLDTAHIRRSGTQRADARWVNFLTTLSGEMVGRLPYERMDREVLFSTPEMIHNIPQPVFEQFVADHLSKDPNVEIRKGVSFVSLVQDAKGVTTTVQERATGHEFQLRSRYVVACDGARSYVRTFLGVESEGEDSYETMMTIHLNRQHKANRQKNVGMLHWLLDPLVGGFVIGYDLSGNQVLISNFDSTKHPVETWNEALCRQVVTSALGTDAEFDVLSYRPWLLSRKVAKQYRIDRVFLAGDAAHSFPPTGGLGLNSGLGDVHNLAWKLAAVLRGEASEELLDTYQADRRQVALVNSIQSVKNGQEIFKLLKTLGVGSSKTVEEARENMITTIHDPSMKASIENGIEAQREHFDNLELHIGYVYGSKAIPPSASDYVPRFEKGARLPHAWIVRTQVVEQSPVDVSYIDEFSAQDIRDRRYSTLDLCPADTFTLITCASEEVHTSSQPKFQIQMLDRDFQMSFANDDWPKRAGLTAGGGLLIRPDQHILAVYTRLPALTDVQADINCYLYQV